MSDAKHTPGPWDVDEGDFSIYQLETGDQIAEMFGHQTPDEVEANARLMASAPDMLATIEALRAENARLREALKPFALSEHKIERWFGMDIPDSYNVVSQWVTVGDLRAAAAALKETGDE
jgi:hypothetical protein